MKIHYPERRPVLLLGWVPRIVVPVARSLQRHGITVDVANFVSHRRIFSRAIRRSISISAPERAPAAFKNEMHDLIQQGGYDMLIPVDDQALLALIENYEEFTQLAKIACPAPEIVRLALRKSSTLELAQRCGIRVPNTRIIANSGELSSLTHCFPFPWVLKPSDKETRVEETKSFILANEKEVAAAFAVPRNFSPPMLLQEYCTGAGVGIEILMHNGECLAVFQHRRLEEFPYSGGFSVTAIAEEPDSALAQKSTALLSAMQWEGPAMVEFKVNPADGSAVLMEVNGRYWGTISLAIAAGLDFPWFHWQVLHGEVPLIPENYAVGKKWRWTAGHVYRLHGLFIEALRSKSAQNALFASLLKLPAVLSPMVFDSLFKISDPLPAAFDLLEALRFSWKYDIGALLRRLPLALVHSSVK